MLAIATILTELRAAKMRIVLTVIAVVIGTVSITCMLAIGKGLGNSFNHMMTNTGKGIIIVRPGMSVRPYQGMPAGQRTHFTQSDLPSIAAFPAVEKILPEVSFAARIYYKKKRARIIPSAVTHAYASLRAIPVAHGRFINRLDEHEKQRVIFLGNNVAEGLFTNPGAAVGEIVTLNHWPFKVIGVMKKKMQIQTYNGPDANHVWIPLSTYRMLTNNNNLTYLIILPKTPESVPEINEKIQHYIAYHSGVDPNDSQITVIKDFNRSQTTTRYFLIGLQVFLGFIGGISLFVAGVGVANVMFMSVKKSTRRIGIQMAVGAKPIHIISHVLLETLIVIVFSGMVGISMSILVLKGIEMIPIPEKIFVSLGQPKPVISLMLIAIVAFVLGFIGLLSGLFPALKASRIDPAVALQERR